MLTMKKTTPAATQQGLRHLAICSALDLTSTGLPSASTWTLASHALGSLLGANQHQAAATVLRRGHVAKAVQV